MRPFKFILYTMVGSALMLVGILYLYNVNRNIRFPGDPPPACWSVESLSGAAAKCGYSWRSFFRLLRSKSRCFRCTYWLPDAHVEAPTAAQ